MLQIIFNVAVIVYLVYLTNELRQKGVSTSVVNNEPGPTVRERVDDKMREHLAKYHRGG